MDSKWNFYLFAILSIQGTLHAQPQFPPNFPVFDSSVVARIDIAIHPDTLQWIYDNVESELEFRASFIFSNGAIQDTIEETGFGLRGNTSRYAQKKSFKISFNTFQPGRKFHGLEKMNLNGEHNDPSVIRSRICWEWLRSSGVPAPRAAHAEVYINNAYYGLYIIVEHIDEEFALSRFGNKDGNLYKCLWPADLKYLGENPDLYKLTAGDRRVYDLMINEEEDDYSDLAHFITVLNQTPDADLACEFRNVFNLDDYLKIMALDVITGNWDGYIYNKNNFYLYHNQATGKFEYMPYDLDNTLGIDWLDRDWGTRDIYDWEQHGDETRPLYTRLLASPEIRDQYSFYFKQILDFLADEDSLFAAIDEVRDLISPSIITDPYYPLDYGYTFADFMNSYDLALGGHVDYGLKPFIQTRKSSALEQLEINDISPVIKYIESSLAIPGEEFSVRAFVEDENASPLVRLQYRLNLGFTQFITMWDDGMHSDLEAGDGTYGGNLGPMQPGDELQWQVSVSDGAGHTSVLPCDPVSISLEPSAYPLLIINEFMASNDNIIADEYGEYEDWLEIYNGDDIAVWLGDKFLSDNLDNPGKWALPDVTMQPGEFLLVWCDEDEGQGPLHANFKLSADGEEIGLFDAPTTGYALLDSVSYGPQETDKSWGRVTDGASSWKFFSEPTPGVSNASSGIGDPGHPGETIRVVHNPVHGRMIRLVMPFTGKLVGLNGLLLWQGEEVRQIPVRDLSSGIYLLVDNSGNALKIILP